MRIFLLVFWLWAAIFIAWIATQVVFPLLTGRPIFPMLRRDRRVAEGDLVQARETSDVKRTRTLVDEMMEGPRKTDPPEEKPTTQRRKPTR